MKRGEVFPFKQSIDRLGATILFAEPIEDYVIIPSCYNSEGAVGFKITDRTKFGFKIVPDADVTFECLISNL